MLHETPQTQRHFYPFPMSPSQIETINMLPFGFQEMALRGGLTIQTIHIISRLAKRNFWDTCKPLSLNRILTDDLNGRLPNLEEACPALMSSDVFGGAAFEKLLCIALMRSSIDLTQRFVGIGSVFIALSCRIIALLPDAIATAQEPERSCLLWISLSLIDSWPDSFEETVSWLRQTSISFPEMDDWVMDDFEQFGQKYIWTPHWSNSLKTISSLG